MLCGLNNGTELASIFFETVKAPKYRSRELEEFPSKTQTCVIVPQEAEASGKYRYALLVIVPFEVTKEAPDAATLL